MTKPASIERPELSSAVAAGPERARDAQRLSALLQARTAQPLAVSLGIAIDLAVALDALHRQGLVHNALSPDAVAWSPAEQRAWLGDCADAVRIGAPRTRLAAAADAVRWRYAAPEQTGRIHSGGHVAGDARNDPRSDLYALGLVLYELLTGDAPFASDDVLELVHAHLALTPRAPAEVMPSLPTVVSDIVVKLLAKSPHARYQSAAALADDLRHARDQWLAHGAVAPFALGRHDWGQRLALLPRLYGRESQAALVRQALEAACRDGAPASMLLVGGYPGSGKTALIRHVGRPIAHAHGGFFIEGKFDQVARGAPFGALIQAFDALVQRLLSEDETTLATWRRDLARALGASGGSVLAQVIPDIAFVIGPQPPPPLLPPAESLNRFRRVFHAFVAAAARPEHPLVIFLDDLQWADAATLKLLAPLLAGDQIRGLLVVGACRDNEVDAVHGLERLAAQLEAEGVPLRHVALPPLHLADIAALIGDALRALPADAEPLAKLCMAKTGGNPFFVVQFLESLERDGHFVFDDAQGRWTYRIDELARTPIGDDVVELMTRRIRRLPPRAQHVLTLAACIGSRFDHDVLAAISDGEARDHLAADLALASAEGLIVPLASAGATQGDSVDHAVAVEPNGRYAFLHDRVQQAAYAVLSPQQRAVLHHDIGRLLLAHASPLELEQNLFDIVHHLNLGRSRIATPAARVEVARLNRRAGLEARTSAAFDAALGFFRAGAELLDGLPLAATAAAANDGEPIDELAFELHLDAAECEYLCGDFDAAQRRLDAIEPLASTDIRRARVLRQRSLLYENQSRYAQALASARAGLALFDLQLPEADAAKAAALEREICTIDRLLAGRDVATLVDLPVMRDPKVMTVMSILTDIWATTFIVGDPTLSRLISATMVRLSLAHGNVAESAYGYVTHAITVGAVRGDYALAYAFGRLALDVNHRFDDTRRRAKIHQQFHAHVNFWCRPYASCVPYAREAHRSGLESGDFLYAGYGTATETWSAILAAQDLAAFVRDYEPTVEVVEKLGNRAFADSVRIILNWARALQGRTLAPLSLSDASIDEAAYLNKYADSPFFLTMATVARLHLACLLGTPAQMLHAAQAAGDNVRHVPGTVWPLVHDFWNAVALAANIDAAPAAKASEWRAAITAARERFERLAVHCAENFRAQALLLAALEANLDGRLDAAITHAEQALEFAAGAGLIEQQAYAGECCARWRRARGEPAIAALVLAQARACWAQWGAAAKVAQLDEHVAIRSGPLGPLAASAANVEFTAPSSPAATPSPDPNHDASDDLDFASVLKAAQAIAAEVELPRLLARLMQIAIENAGAQRGCLIVEDDGAQARVHVLEHAAPAHADAGAGIALDDAASHLPLRIVNYVRRTRQSLVLDDAPADDRYGADPYVMQQRPRSVMAVAVQRHGALAGVLYLENRSLEGAFTPQRLRVMQVLAAQAAIALENARLFDGLKREIRERTQAQAHLSNALAQVREFGRRLEAENVYLRSELIANVSHDLRTPLGAMRGYLDLLHAQGETLSPAKRASYVEVALRQCESLATLTDELFELAKLEFKGLQLDRETFSLAELAFDVMRKFELEAERQGIALEVDAGPPGAAPLPQVDADLGLVERVFDNLIGNALRHTPRGGSITASIAADGPWLLARVTDTGNGIAPDDLPHVFDRFHRGSAGGGAGLGLAIAKRIVELHGGRIGVESRPGATCFEFRLPLGGEGAR